MNKALALSCAATSSALQAFQPSRQIGIGGIELGLRERKYLQQVIDSGRLSYGPFSQRLERLFASMHGCKHAIFCSSGTAALHIGLDALKQCYGWEDGDEVLVPALTFVSTINIVLHNRMRPVLVDVDPETYNINPRQLGHWITPRTRAILPVHLLGMPCDMEALLAFAQQYGLRLIEDSCEAMFASYRGRSVGSFGDVGCFSTYLAHFIAAGIGGFATTNNPGLAEVMRSLMNHGRDGIYLSIDDDQGRTSEELREIVARRFSFARLGYNFRATEFEAAVALAQLEDWENNIKKRQENAAYFIAQLEDLHDRIQLPYRPPDRDHRFMLFPLLLRQPVKQALANYLEERLIETRDFFPVVTQPLYQETLKIAPSDYPNARRIADRGLLIGCHPYITPQERQYVVRKIHEFFQQH